MEKYKYTNAVDMATKDLTLKIPSDVAKKSISMDYNVKVQGEGSYFWTKVIKVDGDDIFATVKDNPVAKPFKFGQILKFNKNNVFAIKQPQGRRRNAIKKEGWFFTFPEGFKSLVTEYLLSVDEFNGKEVKYASDFFREAVLKAMRDNPISD